MVKNGQTRNWFSKWSVLFWSSSPTFSVTDYETKNKTPFLYWKKWYVAVYKSMIGCSKKPNTVILWEGKHRLFEIYFLLILRIVSILSSLWTAAIPRHDWYFSFSKIGCLHFGSSETRSSGLVIRHLIKTVNFEQLIYGKTYPNFARAISSHLENVQQL